MTKQQDFLNMLTNPTHTTVKLELRALRKRLREVHWKLKYRFDRKTNTFYMVLNPTAVTIMDSKDVLRLLGPLAGINGCDIDVERHRHGQVYADIYLFNRPA